MLRPALTRLGLRRLPRAVRLVAPALALLLGAAGARAAEDAYLFYLRGDLVRLIEDEPEEIVGKRVVVTDELALIWPVADERKNELDGTEYVTFDTVHFKCLIPRDDMGEYLESIWADASKGYGEVIEKIEAVNERQRKRELTRDQANEDRRRLYWELYRVWRNRPIVTVFGKVDRAELWGPIARGAEGSVDTERVVIVADRAEKPRQRWYESLDE